MPEETKKGMTKCLGWCGKEFLSPDKTNIRFCSACKKKKDAAQQRKGNIQAFARNAKGEFYSIEA